jgi:hypothetical protein
METKIINKTEDSIVVSWSGKTGFGELVINYNGNGGYHIDAEFIGINTLIEIIKNIDI